jgi:DNA-binding response OmpR family regulator
VRPINRSAAGAWGGAGTRISLPAMPTVLLATDADWIHEAVDAALAGPDQEVFRVRRGADVIPAMHELEPDLVVLDLQIGNMGGMATCMAIRHDESANRLPITAVLMLLDRAADQFLARRSEADGWLIKPLDSFRLRKAAKVLVDGFSYFEAIDEETDLPTGTAATA